MTLDPPIRVLLADPHALFRRGVRLVLDDEPDIVVVGETGDGLEAADCIAELVPDVVLIDTRLPGLSGIEVTRRVRAATPNVQVAMLTVSESDDDLFAAIRAGATGYLLKEVSIEELPDAVRAVARGHSLVSPTDGDATARRVQRAVASGRRAARQRARGSATASSRCCGSSLGACRTRRSPPSSSSAENTVKNHVRNILEKLQLRSRMEAAMYAVRETPRRRHPERNLSGTSRR